MRLAPRGAHLDDPRYSLSFTVLGVAVCQEGTAQCSVSMGGGGGGGGAGMESICKDRMAAGASMGWAAAGVGILGRLPDPFTGQNTVCLTGHEPDGPRRRDVL